MHLLRPLIHHLLSPEAASHAAFGRKAVRLQTVPHQIQLVLQIQAPFQHQAQNTECRRARQHLRPHRVRKLEPNRKETRILRAQQQHQLGRLPQQPNQQMQLLPADVFQQFRVPHACVEPLEREFAEMLDLRVQIRVVRRYEEPFRVEALRGGAE